MSEPFVIPELDRKGLREFGLTTGGIVAVLFGLFFPWLLERPTPPWPWILCAVLVALGLAVPTALGPVYRVWMRFGHLMSKVTTPIIMGAVFYIAVTPLGLVMRLAGKDGMLRKFDKAANTYRVPSKAAPANRLEKPF